jgi:hypothetical protein
MLDLSPLREEYIGNRVFDGKQMVDCKDCGRHKVCYGVVVYLRPRDRNNPKAGTEELPALDLICPQCLCRSTMPIYPSLAGKLRALPVDAEDRSRLENAGWLERAASVPQAIEVSA